MSFARWIACLVFGTIAAMSALSLADDRIEPIAIGKPLAQSRVPAWNASGLGPIPWQGVSAISISADGNTIAVGTMAPLSDPNVIVLDGSGKVIEHHAVGQRWISDVSVYGPGAVGALCTSPTGAAGDAPGLFRFFRGKETGAPMNDVSGPVFQYGEHSNHLPQSIGVDHDELVVCSADGLRWFDFGNKPTAQGRHSSRGLPIAFAAAERIGAIGTVATEDDATSEFRNLSVVAKGKLAWSREPADAKDVEAAEAPPIAKYGPLAKFRDRKVWAPLSVAMSREATVIASADYQGWERLVEPRTPDQKLKPWRTLGYRFVPARPTIHMYDADGERLRTIAASTFPRGFWCDLRISQDGKRVLAFPHSWASRALAGQPRLPADDGANTMWVMPVGSGAIHAVTLPDAISDVSLGGKLIAVSCWDGNVYLLGEDDRPIAALPNGFSVGSASMVRVTDAGDAIIIATAKGAVHRLDNTGKLLWTTDLDKSIAHANKPDLAKRKATEVGPDVWLNNTGRAQSDLGRQVIIKAPDGLIMVDPNSGHSFEQNWAGIVNIGLDPMQVKFILPTHEHGDHAPGAYLWRVITGAKVVASPEMASTLQHDLPNTSGYGFHPPVPVDIVVEKDQDIDMAGLKVRAVRTPGHTYGAMSWFFEQKGRKYVCLGDLIMPDGPLGYFGSVNFNPHDVLESLRKLDSLKPDFVICGHATGTPDHFIGSGIAAGEATGWGHMQPIKPDPFYLFESKNYQVVSWLDHIYSAAFGDIDGDGLDDIAVLAADEQGLVVKVYLNHGGTFNSKPDRVLEIPGIGAADRIRIGHLTGKKTADLMIASESDVVLALAGDQSLTWTLAPLRGIQRAACFAADASLAPPQAVIGGRFVQSCHIATLQPNGALKTGDLAVQRSYFETQLVDVNGDGKTDLVTSAGEIFLRKADGTLPTSASLTLERPFGQWTFLAVGDFNGDGKPDIVQLGGEGVHTMAAIYYNTGDPVAPYHLKPDATLDIGMQLERLRDGPTVGDFNGDGIDDLIIGNAQRGDVLVLFGQRATGLARDHSTRLKLDYRMHFDTKLGLLKLDDKGHKAIAGFGVTTMGASGVYIRPIEK